VGTPLQDVYDAFFIKTDGYIFTSKEALVFQYFKTALGYVKNTIIKDLTYTKDEDYSGEFNIVLGDNDIQLISLYMKQEHNRKLAAKFENIKQHIGTKDFDKLPNVSTEYKTALLALENIANEIYLYKQEFYTYAGV